MSLIESSIIAGAGLLPGTIALGIALAPRSRSSRATKITPRFVGAILLSGVCWSSWSLLTGGAYSEPIARFLFGSDEMRITGASQIMAFSGGEAYAVVLMAIVSLAVGLVFALANSAFLLGAAISDYNLKCPSGPRRWFLHYPSKAVYFAASWLCLGAFLRPAGAGYAIVIMWMLKHEYGGSASLYVDVLQGDHKDEQTGKHGTLYTGQLEHIVCGADGSAATIVLRDARRWTVGPDVVDYRAARRAADAIEVIEEQSEHESTHQFVALDRSDRRGFKKISAAKGFVISGSNIRNLSFRPIIRTKAEKALAAEIQQAKEILDSIQSKVNEKDAPPAPLQPTSRRKAASKKPQ